MSTAITTIVNDVRTCIDEIAVNDSEFEGQQDSEELEAIIRSKIADALHFVYLNADASLLEPDEVLTTYTSTSTSTSSNGVAKATVSLGSNFIRLVYAKFSSWTRFLGQRDLIACDDKKYATLSDPYTTGTPDNPKAALAYSGATRVLELYQPSISDTLSVGIMKEPVITSSSTAVDIPPTVYRAVIYYIAGLVFVTFGDDAKSRMMFDQANDLMGFRPHNSNAQQ